MSSRMDYPWQACEGQTPMPEAVRLQFRREQGLGAWNVLGGLYGNRSAVRAAQKTISRELRSIGRVLFFDDNRLNLATQFTDRFSWIPQARTLARQIDHVRNGFDLLKGVPNREHLNGARWRTHIEGGDIRDSGLIWVSPVAPMTSHHAEQLLQIVQPIFHEFQFDPLITLTSINERALCCVTSINFDKKNRSDADRAANCEISLRSELKSAGYYCYRESSLIRDPGKT